MQEGLIDPQGLLRTQAGRKQELGVCLHPIPPSLPPTPPSSLCFSLLPFLPTTSLLSVLWVSASLFSPAQNCLSAYGLQNMATDNSLIYMLPNQPQSPNSKPPESQNSLTRTTYLPCSGHSGHGAHPCKATDGDPGCLGWTVPKLHVKEKNLPGWMAWRRQL